MIDLIFPVYGDRIPSDHNYGLYSALIHQDNHLKDFDWKLGTITGIPRNDGTIKIGSESKLIIRCPLEKIAHFQLNQLRIGKHEITLGTPQAKELSTSNLLHCRIAVIKGAETPPQFLDSAIKQIPPQTAIAIGQRKKIKIKRFTVVGFEIFAQTENPKQLQTQGIGGKQKIGCGLFFEKGRQLSKTTVL